MKGGTIDVKETEKINSAPFSPNKVRINVFDNFRGLFVLIYVVQSCVGAIQGINTPSWFGHNWGNLEEGAKSFLRMGLLDVGPSAFYFILGLTCVTAFQSKLKYMPKKQAYKEFCYRYLTLMGIVAIVYVGQAIFAGAGYLFGAVHAIAVTGVLATPFLGMNKWQRLATAVIILGLFYAFNHQIISLLTTNEFALDGGFAICVGYLGITLLATFLSELYLKDIRHYAVALIPLAGLGVYLYFFEDFLAIDSFYCIMTGFIVTCLGFLIYAVFDKYVLKGKQIPLVAALGRSLLLFFFLKTVLGLIITPIVGDAIEGLATTDPKYIAVVWGVALSSFALLMLIGYVFQKKNIVIKL